MIETLDIVGARLFAAACACRVGPVVHHFGEPNTKREFAAILADLWLLAATADDASPSAENLLERLEACPESSIDDSYRRGYFAMRALGVLFDAISTARSVSVSGARANALDASNGAASLAGDIEFVVRETDKKSVSVPTSESETEFQMKLLELVADPRTRSAARVQLACHEGEWPEEPLLVVDAARGWSKVAEIRGTTS